MLNAIFVKRRADLLTAYAKADKKSLLGALLTIVLWSSAFAGIRAGLESYTPESLALFRYGVASLVLIGLAFFRRVPIPDLEDIPAIAVLGFLGFTVYNVALNAGEVGISAGVASFIIASAPIYITLIATLFLDESFSRWGWFGILTSFSGVTIISLAGEAGFSINTYALLILLAAISQALYSTGQKRYLRKYGAMNFITYAVLSGTFFMLIFTPQLIADFDGASTEATLAIIYMGIFPGAIAYASWSFVLSRLPASIAGSFLYLVPAFAILIAWIWLGEVPPLLSIGGGTLVMIGVLIVNTYGKR